MTVLDLLQWRATIVTVFSGWFVASREAVLDFPHSIRLRRAAQFARPTIPALSPTIPRLIAGAKPISFLRYRGALG